MINHKKIIAVIPAYNEAKAIARTINAIPKDFVDGIIVVDDGSIDNTAQIARSMGAKVVVHAKNSGYGSAQKTGYREALNLGADVAVMVHSDFQYDPTMVPQMIKPIVEGRADATFGSRMHSKKSALRGGMPIWKFIPNIILSLLEEVVFRLGLSEYHTGYRAFSRKVLEGAPLDKNSNNYVFDTEMIAQLSFCKFRVVEVPIPTRYAAESSSMGFMKSCQYGLMTLAVVLRFILHKLGVKSYSVLGVRK